MKIKFNTALIDEYIDAYGMSKLEFCQHAKITPRHFVKVMSHDLRNVPLVVYINLANLLNVSVHDLAIRC